LFDGGVDLVRRHGELQRNGVGHHHAALQLHRPFACITAAMSAALSRR
jgi:hypothetical protein